MLQFIDDFNDAMAEASASLAMWRRLSEESGRPVSFNLAQNPFWEDGLSLHVLDYIAQANQEGLRMKAQVCNRPIGALFGSNVQLIRSCSRRATAPSPTSAGRACVRGCATRMRAKLLAETPSDPNVRLVEWVRDFEHMYPLGDPPNYSPNPARFDRRRVRGASGRPALDYVYDICWSRTARASSTTRSPTSGGAISTSSTSDHASVQRPGHC